MNEYIVKNGKKLRLGYTTGTCAAAAAKAAALMALTGRRIEAVRVRLPVGEELTLPLEDVTLSRDSACCAVKKDGGDDPDATHGMLIYARADKTGSGISLSGGKGIGTVTKEGLPCRVGEPAINPVPKKMILANLRELMEQENYKSGLHIEIFAPAGEEIAKRTFNARLGILGGISILGTTGLVEPMSESAIVETIRLEIATKSKNKILLLTPGNYGMDFAENALGLNIDKGVKCSNYMGEALDFLAYSGITRVLLVGHVGKLVKLAAGVMNTHSKVADCRNEVFAAHAALCGAEKNTVRLIMEAPTTDEIHRILVASGIEQPVYGSILNKILFHLRYRLGEKTHIEVIVFSKENGLLMESPGAGAYIETIKEQV